MTLKIARFSGAALTRHIDDLARLRIDVFRAFPYLYDGDMDYEREYLRTYTDAEGSVIVLAFDGDTVVGASTGVPMRHETEEFKRPFLEHGYDVDGIFYCGESVLRGDYRGRGAGVRFFQEREAHARELGGMRWSCFCAVERPADHPLRPAGYLPLDGFWRRRGYRRHPELRTRYRWRDVGDSEPSDKPMGFWLKPLASA